MKRIGILISLLLFGFVSFAQEEIVEDANFFVNKGNKALQDKDYAGAYENYSKALGILKEEGVIDTSMTYNTGYCAYKEKKYEEATPYLEESAQLGYKEEMPYMLLMACYLKTSDLEAGEAIAQKSIAKYPDNEKLQELAAKIYLKKGLVFFKKGNAIKKAANESGLNTTDPEAFKAEYEKANVEYRKALPFFEEAYKYDPGKMLNIALNQIILKSQI